MASDPLEADGGAMLSYEERNGHLPPAVELRDKEGQPLYRWRVLILPMLGRTNDVTSFRLDEPWDESAQPHIAQACRRFYASLGEQPRDRG